MMTRAEIDKQISKGPYEPTWESLGDFQMPRWFTKAKFGIFIHWGPYSVPAFNNEWYARNMYIEGYQEYEHHIKIYGPQKDFGFKDFIPQLTGEHFNAGEWVNLFKQAGAKYIFPVAEHHDGFQMYDSEISDFNAKKMGPKRDVLGELKQASERAGIHFGTSSHRAEHWWFLGNGRNFESDVKEPLSKSDLYWPAMPEPDAQDLFSVPYPHEEFLDDWLLRTCELIKKYEPELLYFDWWIQHDAFKDMLKKLVAYYYNIATEWDKEVAVCYKHDALAFGSGIPEVERGKFKDAKPFYWQTDTAIAKNSWCYTTTLDYKSVNEILIDLIETVSKNGNLLLNVGPKADGSIPEKDKEILTQIGSWLDINGAGIFDSKVWRIAGEGPTKVIEGQFQDQKKLTYTNEDIRYTCKGENIYAFILGETTNNNVILPALSISEDQNNLMFHGIIEEVILLGYDSVKFEQKQDGLHVNLPDSYVGNELPIVIEIKTK